MISSKEANYTLRQREHTIYLRSSRSNQKQKDNSARYFYRFGRSPVGVCATSRVLLSSEKKANKKSVHARDILHCIAYKIRASLLKKDHPASLGISKNSSNKERGGNSRDSCIYLIFSFFTFILLGMSNYIASCGNAYD